MTATTFKKQAVNPSYIVTLDDIQTLLNKTFVAPVLGVATATSINGLIITTTTGTLTLAALKVLTVNNTLTFTGVDGSTLAIGTGGTLGTAAYTAATAYEAAGGIATHAALTATHGVTGAVVGTTNSQTLTNKTLTAPVISSIVNGAATLTMPSTTGTLALTSQLTAGTVTAVSVATANGVSGSSSGGATPALTIALGAITPSSVNGIILAGTAGKTFTLSNTLTLAGTDGSTLNVGTGGTLGTAAYTAATAYAPAIGSSAITTLGTIGSGIWNGSTIGIAYGGTGQATKAAAFDALQPMTTAGDLIYGGVNGTGTRLPKGADGTSLIMSGGYPVWSDTESGDEVTTNKVTSISGASTDVQYPSAKLLYDQLALKQAANVNLTSLATLSYASASFVKMTGANTFTLDTNTYLTSLSGAVLTDQTSGQTIGDTTNRLTKLWATDVVATYVNGLIVDNRKGADANGYNIWIGGGGRNSIGIGGGFGDAGSYNTAIGAGSLLTITTGQRNTAFGLNSLYSLTTGDSNIGFGERTLVEITTGSRNLAIGNSAGFYAVGSDEFYLDNQPRGSNANEKIQSLMYGTFNADPALQTLQINATVTTKNLSGTNTGDQDLGILPQTTVTATTTLSSAHYTVFCNKTTAMTINLPAAASHSGRVYIVKNINTGVVTVDGNASETIDGALTVTLAQYEGVTIQSTGISWYIL